MTMATSPFGDSVPVQKLADGYAIPTLALGVWQTPEGQQTRDAVRWALEVGYRHIDTAQGYGNEESVGEGFRQSGLDRDDVFITTKFYPGSRDPVRELEASLQRLRLDYVDLYLVHWPQGGPTWAWPGMERAQAVGYARSIGVSNFSIAELEQVFAVASTPPVANQINLNTFSYRKELVEENRRRNMVTEAYSPLGTGRHLSNPKIQEIAECAGRTP
jgi:diketogulonate reductase-like aldo/keto reductase